MRSLSDHVYNAADPRSTMSLVEAEELLLGIDAALGDGSGKVLESAGFVLGSRLLSHRGSVVVPGDVVRTIARLRTPVELPYEGARVVFDLTETDVGFELALGVLGHPRSTRILRHLCVGYVKAAYTFGHNRNPEELKLFADVIGDRASISGRFRQPSMLPPPAPSAGAQSGAPGPRRSLSKSRIPAAGSLSAEVDRIFERTTLPPQSRRPGARSSSSFRAVRESQPPPAFDRESSSPPPPRTAADRQDGRPASEIRQRGDMGKKPGGGRTTGSTGQGSTGRAPSGGYAAPRYPAGQYPVVPSSRVPADAERPRRESILPPPPEARPQSGYNLRQNPISGSYELRQQSEPVLRESGGFPVRRPSSPPERASSGTFPAGDDRQTPVYPYEDDDELLRGLRRRR
ncbi:MAG: hypothetical protein H6718_31515 [Polyangiaceae bacterium]|nr:hypothetical protein [Myxococcales bacterium]MCB9589985.1 hypothetical protein [Polyangiaceae bacterium]